MWCSESLIIQPQGKPLPLDVELDQAVQKHVAAQSAYTIFVSYKYKLTFNLPTPVPTVPTNDSSNTVLTPKVLWLITESVEPNKPATVKQCHSCTPCCKVLVMTAVILAPFTLES